MLKEITSSYRLYSARSFAFLLCLMMSFCLKAQTQLPTGESLFPWAYSAGFGTGGYQFGNEKIYVLKMEPKVSLPWGESKGLDVSLRLPVTVGFQDFDLEDLGDINDIDDILDGFRTFTFVPGIQVEIPIKGSWILRPYAHYGVGSSEGKKETAEIYYYGLVSRVELPAAGKMEVQMINSLESFHQNPSNGPSAGYSALVTGFAGHYPMGSISIFKQQLFFQPHIAHYWYFNSINFNRPLLPPVELNQELEVALSFGVEKRISLKVWGFDRLGLGYRWGKDSSGIRIFFNSVFL